MALNRSLFVLGLAALAPTGEAQGWRYTTELFPLTGVTPATLPPGQTTGYYQGVQQERDWIKRWGWTWYFDRICPCNWGCTGCSWCQHDTRRPYWYPAGTRSEEEIDYSLYDSTNGTVTPLNTAALYDCIEDLNDDENKTGRALIITPGENYVDEVPRSVETVLTYFEHERILAFGQRSNLRGGTHFRTVINTPRDGVYTWARTFNTNGIQMHTPQSAGALAFFYYVPGTEYGDYAWFYYTYSIEWAYATMFTFWFYIYEESITVEAGKDVLVWWDIYRHGFKGSITADIPVRSRWDAARYYLYWKVEVPRAGYTVYVTSNDNQGWNYYYPRVNEILCGEPADPAVCRSFDIDGVAHQRVTSDMEGAVGPYINRTVYDWNPTETNYELRHTATVLEQRTLILMTDYHLIVNTRLPSEYSMDGRNFLYNTENPHLSFKP